MPVFHIAGRARLLLHCDLVSQSARSFFSLRRPGRLVRYYGNGNGNATMADNTSSASGYMPLSLVLPGGRRLSYRFSHPAANSNSQKVVILSNSLASPFRSWDLVLPQFLSLGLSVLCYDQVGHGQSSVPSSEKDIDATTFTSLANDAKTLLDHLKLDQVHAWVGVSMGAATGLTFAAANPGRIRKLVICDTITRSAKAAGGADPFEPRVQVARKAASAGGGLEPVVSQTLDRWFQTSWQKENPGEIRRMKDIMLTTQVDGFVACVRALQDENFDLQPAAQKIGSCVDEVLLVVGSLDANLPSTMEDMRQDIQSSFEKDRKKDVNVQLKIVDNAGHMPFIDGKEQWEDYILDFLK
jgi:3-oxoadipate enol-lactonase